MESMVAFKMQVKDFICFAAHLDESWKVSGALQFFKWEITAKVGCFACLAQVLYFHFICLGLNLFI